MTNSSSGGKSNRGGNHKQQQRRQKQPRQQQTKAAEATATEAITAARINKGHLRLQSGLGLEVLAISEGSVSWSETRPLGDICCFSFLSLKSLYYFYLNMGLFHSRKKAQKGEISRDPEPIALFPSPRATTENVSDATNTVRQRTPGFARFRAELVQ